MNPDNKEPEMDNSSISTSSTTSTKPEKKKKAKATKLKTEPALNDVIGQSQKKSFWKNLFRIKSRHNAESESTSSESKAMPNQRLSSIFEESTTTEEKPNNEIQEIKNTLRRMSETSHPSLILNGVLGHETVTDSTVLKDDALLGYLSDISSSSDDEEEEEEDEEKKIETENTETETNKPETQEQDKPTQQETTDDPKPKEPESDAKKSKENLTVKDAYSFEYSEASDSSNDDVIEEKTEKVKFDDKVETKDADSIITVRPLNESDSKIDVNNDIPNSDHLNNSNSQDQNAENNVTENSTTLPGEIINDQKAEFDFPAPENVVNIYPEETSYEEPSENEMFLPAVPIIATDIPIPVDAYEIITQEILQKDDETRYLDQSEPSCSGLSQSSFAKQSTTTNPEYIEDIDVTIEESESCEELELWNENLTSSISSLPETETLTSDEIDDDNLDNETYREFRLNKYFKMIQCNNNYNISVAYDPVFANCSILDSFPNSDFKPKTGEEKNKVIRKRKMMSLLHDKHVFKDYLRELEEASGKVSIKTEDLKLDKISEKEETDDNEITDVQQKQELFDKTFTDNNLFFNNRLNSSNSTQPATELSNPKVAVTKNSSFKKVDVLLTLENTKTKLERYIEMDTILEKKIKSLYPNNYLQVYSLITNQTYKQNINNSLDNSSSSSLTSDEIKQSFNEIINTADNILMNTVLSNEIIPENDNSNSRLTITETELKDIEVSNDTVDNISELSVDKIETNENQNQNKHQITIFNETVEKIKTYQEVDLEVDLLIQELLSNFSDLKRSCIEQGVSSSNINSESLLTFTSVENHEKIVKDILNDMLLQMSLTNDSLAENLRKLQENDENSIKKSETQINEIIPKRDFDYIQGCFGNPCLSFITECGNINDNISLLNFKITPIIKGYNNKTQNVISLTDNLERATSFLSTIYDEICEFNPLPTCLTRSCPLMDDLYINDPTPTLTPTVLTPSSVGQEQTSSVSSSSDVLSLMMTFLEKYDQTFSSKSIQSLQETASNNNPNKQDKTPQKSNNSNETSGNKEQRNEASIIADDIMKNIENKFIMQAANEKTKKFFNTPDINLNDIDDQITVTSRDPISNTAISRTDQQIEETNCRIINTNDGNPNIITESQKFLTISENTTITSDADDEKNSFKNQKYNRDHNTTFNHLINSLVNTNNPSNNPKNELEDFVSAGSSLIQDKSKFEPQPSTSKQPDYDKLQKKKSFTSTISLPSVPSTEIGINIECRSSVFDKNDKYFETLMMRNLDLADNSTEELNPEELNTLYALSTISTLSDETAKLERKKPKTNFLNSFDSNELKKSIEENFKTFENNMREASLLQEKTINILNTPDVCSTLTPDGSITILSTISANMVNYSNVNIKNSEKSQDTINENTSKIVEKSQSDNMSQKWYGNILNNKFKKCNDVPKLSKISENVLAKCCSPYMENIMNNTESDINAEITMDKSDSIKTNYSYPSITETLEFEESSDDYSSATYVVSSLYLSCLNFDVVSVNKLNTGKLKGEAKITKELPVETQANHFCCGLKNLMTDDFTNKYFMKHFNFGIKPGSLISEELHRKAKHNFGQNLI